MAGTIRTGMAGWVFPEWRGGQFYPEGLKQKEELHWASRAVTSIEINATFYQNQKPASFENWASQTPENFVFTVKGHQQVTHIKRLKDVDQPLEFFFNSIESLGDRLGAVCWQLPGNLKFDAERIEAFLQRLPKTIRQAIEVRSKTYADPVFLDLLRAHNVALVISDTADWPYVDQTADFTYCRLQGAPGSDHYEPAGLDAWAANFKALSTGKLPSGETIAPASGTQPQRDVFAFFVSTDKPNAPVNALGIQRRLGIKPTA
ncbi:MAG: DUF72 domain-containing protein [Hyphomicrobiales bacterium]|nr:MAG: DUF72 domain-containing protein [Hyphomicrobiales bacterium]